MCYMGVIPQTTPGAQWAQDIRWRIARRLDLWESSQHAALITGNVAEIFPRLTRTECVSEETEARAFNSKLMNGKVLEYVRGICGKGAGGDSISIRCRYQGWATCIGSAKG